MKTIATTLILSLFTGFVSTSASAEENKKSLETKISQSLVEFHTETDKNIEWIIKTDRVMGGRSIGNVEISEKGIMKFSGEIALENNGGFSYVQSSKLNLDISKDLGIHVRVKGDGRQYLFRLNSQFSKTNSSRYKSILKTKKDEWIEVKLPFSNFFGGLEPGSLPERKLNLSTIIAVGFMIYDKAAGPFVLEVDWIRTYAKDDNNSTPNKNKLLNNVY